MRLLKLLATEPGASVDRSSVMRKYALSEDQLDPVLKEIDALQPNLLQHDTQSLKLRHFLDFLDAELIYKAVHGSGRVEVVDYIDSTNTCMLQKAKNLASGDVLLAECQGAGRGRRGGKWSSGIGSSLMLSMAWNFPKDRELRGLSLAVGVLVAKALQKFSAKKISVKWPNDLYIDQKKLGGILIESVCIEDKLVVIVGLGVNVIPHFDHGSFNGTYAFLTCEGYKGLRNDVAISVIDELRNCCRRFVVEGFKPFREELQSLDHLRGRMITISDEVHTIKGEAQGVDEDGALLIKNNDGLIRAVAGHIEEM